ncbi:MAG: metallophosphoesterase [Gemmatimonadota bacterium]
MSTIQARTRHPRETVLLLAILSLLSGCSDPTTGTDAVTAGSELPFTFLIASDMHYGVHDSVISFNQEIIEAMNRLPDTPYPDRIDGVVDVPLGLLITGDLTEDGHADEWEAFAAELGLEGERALRYPVYEGFGNHDGPVDGPVRSGIQARNANRPGVTNVSENGLHYSWVWGDVHFVSLNSYPSYAWDPECEWCHYFTRSFREPEESLQFLEEDLRERVGDSGRQVILYFHYGFDDWGRVWWTDAERDDFHSVIEKYDVLAIFHGHSHNIQFSDWRGIPVFCVGSTQKTDGPGRYMVVRVTADSLHVVERSLSDWGETAVLPRR